MKFSTVLTGAAAAAAFIYYENYTIEVERIEVNATHIPPAFDGLRILQISDFHCKNFGGGNKKLYKTIDELCPDIILMTGDMISRESQSMDLLLRLAKEIGGKYKVYYTIGNHELDLSGRMLEEIFAAMRGYGVKVLDNEHVVLRRGEGIINLYGMWYSLPFYKNKYNNYRKHLKFDSSEMYRLLGDKEEGYTILMAHNPLDFRVYAQWGADLTFSGHIHGGVIRLGKYGGVLSPGRSLFPEYYAGEYDLGEHKLLVSRGLGGPRFFNRPHLLLATLRASKGPLTRNGK